MSWLAGSRTRLSPGYVVTGALTAQPHCDCPAAVGGSVCKHIVKVMLMLHKTEREVLKAWGTLRGTAPGDALIASWTAAPPVAEHAGSGNAQQACGGAEQQAGGGAEHISRAEHPLAGRTNSTALQRGSQQRQPAAPPASGGSALVCRVDSSMVLRANLTALLAQLEGEPVSGSIMQAAAAESQEAAVHSQRSASLHQHRPIPSSACAGSTRAQSARARRHGDEALAVAVGRKGAQRARHL